MNKTAIPSVFSNASVYLSSELIKDRGRKATSQGVRKCDEAQLAALIDYFDIEDDISALPLEELRTKLSKDYAYRLIMNIEYGVTVCLFSC